MTIWLEDCSEVGAPAIAGLPAVKTQTLPTQLPPVQDNGERLVKFPPEISTMPIYSLQGWESASPNLYVREVIVHKLNEAQRGLPAGFDFVVLDAWRSIELQNELLSHYYGDETGLAEGYVSRTDDPDKVPPHLTGGAVDITLAWNSLPLQLGTDFDSFDERAWPQTLETTGEEPARSLRRLLTASLGGVGFIVYPLEWWHFSYGDQLWAHFRNQPHAIYGAAVPPT